MWISAGSMTDMTLEFSRPVAVERLAPRETRMEIEAGDAERRALAARFGLLDLPSLKAVVRLRPIQGTRLVRVTGEFAADVVQACVVTLAPVAAHVAEGFELVYGPEEMEFGAEIIVDLDTEDPPEPIIDGVIDIGEAVAEHLALALDPFPRAPGALLPEMEAAPDDVAPKNPFAILAALKDKPGGEQK